MTFQSHHEGEQGQMDISVLNNNTRPSTTDRHFHINKSNQYLDIPEMGPEELGYYMVNLTQVKNHLR